jgi:hypothetical protein
MGDPLIQVGEHRFQVGKIYLPPDLGIFKGYAPYFLSVFVGFPQAKQIRQIVLGMVLHPITFFDLALPG